MRDGGPDGFRILPVNAEVAAWARAVAPVARRLADRGPRRHGGTWFAGVDALPNDAAGRIDGGPPLPGVLRDALDGVALHRAQVSAVYPGYPGRDPDEGEGQARFRRLRAAAHVDGLLPVGPARRRHLREPHAAILGIPLAQSVPGAAPLTLWRGSHGIIGAALARALRPHAPAAWPDVDLTEAYAAARRACFDACERIELTPPVGAAVLLHRHLLHGIAPWTAPPGPPRIVAYFRPLLANIGAWAPWG